MALMARQLYFDYPQYYNLFSRRSENAGVAHVRNTNWRFLDGYRGADGIKTGYTRAAGYNLAASAQRGGKHVIVVVFGGRSTVDRHQRIVELMDRGFRQAPERVAIRRPSPPDYSRTPPVVVAEAPGAGGQSAARVVRMQPAPARSPVPQRRPGADLPDVPEELIASLQNSINEALASANQPVGETIVTEEAVQAALAAAPDRSLAPAARPETAPTLLAEAVEEALETEAETETETEPETEIALADAEAAGFSVIDAETYAALTEDGADTLALDLGRDPEPETEAGNEALLESELAAAGPEPRPELAAPDVESDAVDAVVAEAAEATGTTLPDDLTHASLAPAVPAEPGAGMPEEVAAAQILWRNEAPLAEVASRAATAAEGLIVLTTSDTEEEAAEAELAGRSALPEVVTRVSTSGGRVWSIDLGLHPSRFDAERVAIRAALAETAILSTGLRRVSPRSGRFAAGIHSLTEDEAEIACLRLSARGHACEVIHP
jgi:D-alanyl-D-alanine carboxypeptidase